jgi:4-aminobutyrate aminotransferase-like enzyme
MKDVHSSDEIIRLEREFSVQAYRSTPIVLERGQGPFVWDIDGKRYLDFSAHFCSLFLGYGNEEMTKAIREQLEKLPLVCPQYVNTLRVDLSRLLAKITPGNLSKCWFGCTGTDATEAALQFARKCTKKFKVISHWRDYHGCTMGSVSASGNWLHWKDLGPLSTGYVHVSPPYCYRCDFGLDYPECDLFCLTMLEKMIVREGPETVAALIIEPILAGAGVIVPPREYLPELRKVCSRHNVLLIVDEVATGFGITGKIFACEHYALVPDMLTLGKGFTSGYVPGSAVVVSRDLDVYDASDPCESTHLHTHSGNPLTMAAAITNIEIILREKLSENANKVGEYLLRGLLDLAEKDQTLAEVRGKGLLVGIEVVSEKSRESDFERVQRIRQKCIEKGLLVEAGGIRGDNSVIVLHPPLIINQDHADTALEILGDAIHESRT